MPKKIVFIGSGSLVFTRNLVRDLLTFDKFRDADIALVDINETNLALSKKAVDGIVEAGKYPAHVIATTDRREVLEGADGVVTTIAVGSTRDFFNDVAIPTEYGLSINIGDTRGPSAVFRFLRTYPQMAAILKDIEELCPDALWLNYTNPMAMLCRAMQGSTDKVAISGLCHSVQGTASMLCRFIGAPEDEVTYLCAGINHQAHYIKFDWNGKDAIPLIRKAVLERPEIYNEEQVRNEMFLHLGYYVTESSGHNSEYVWWFRKRPDLIEKYCTHGTGWNPGHDCMKWRREKLDETTEERHIREFGNFDPTAFSLERGHEYAAFIFNAVFGDNEMFHFNGNVRNFGLIDNLPYGCCVEVPVLASKRGLEPIKVGKLPAQLATLNTLSANCEELAVEGALEGDPQKIYWSCLYDPLTATACSMAEVKEMVDKLFEANRDWLPNFKHFN